MAVRLSADTFEHSLGFLEDFAKAAVKAPQNSIPMIVGGAVGGLTYLNNKREGEDTLPSITSALVAGGLAGLATNAALHHFALPARGPQPKLLPPEAPTVTPPPSAPHPSTPQVPPAVNTIPATPEAQVTPPVSSAAPVANPASSPKTAPVTTLNSSTQKPPTIADTPVPTKPYEGVDPVPRRGQQQRVKGQALEKRVEDGTTYIEPGVVPEHLKGKPAPLSEAEIAADAKVEREDIAQAEEVAVADRERAKAERKAKRSPYAKEDAAWDAQNPDVAAD
jgi:hypothetical protein